MFILSKVYSGIITCLNYLVISILLIIFIYFFEAVFVMPLFNLTCILLKSFFLKQKRVCIQLIVNLSIPIFTHNLPTIKESAIHNLNTFLGINVFFKFYLYYSIGMSLKKTDSFNFTNFTEFCCNIRFNLRHFSLNVCLLRYKHMLHNNYSKSLTLIFILLIPTQHFLFVFSRQRFLNFSLFFGFSFLVLLVFLVKMCFLNFYYKPVSYFASIQHV